LKQTSRNEGGLDRAGHVNLRVLFEMKPCWSAPTEEQKSAGVLSVALPKIDWFLICPLMIIFSLVPPRHCGNLQLAPLTTATDVATEPLKEIYNGAIRIVMLCL
jgi:hypothetical protein